MNLKVLHILSSINPEKGGVSKAVSDIIRGLELSKFDCFNEVVTLDDPNDFFIHNYSFKIYPLGDKITSWGYSRRLLPWLLEYSKNYNVIILHGLWQYQSYAIIQLLKKNRQLVYYIMPHGMLDPYFQKAEGRKLKAIRNFVVWKLLERIVVIKAEGLLFTCVEEKILASKIFADYNPKSEHVIGLGIEAAPIFVNSMTEAISNKIPDWNGKPFWLFLGRIHPKKGVDILVDSFLKLEEQGMILPQLVIAGPGAQTAYGQKIISQAKLSKNIFFTGMLSGDQKWGALYNAKWFILPSHQENFGIAVVEALACKTPVAISNQVNIWREIDAGKGGVVFEDTNDGVTQGLELISGFSEPDLVNFRENAVTLFTKSFTVSEAANKLIQILKLS